MKPTHETTFHLKDISCRGGGRKVKVVKGEESPEVPKVPDPKPDIPHPLAKRMALAITCKQMIESGVVKDAAEMARIAGVTRARMTQVMNLNLLAPEIQERLLSLVKGLRVDKQMVLEMIRKTVWKRQLEEAGIA